MTEKKIYQVKWDDKAIKQLKKIDKTTAKKIYEAVGKDLSSDPYGKGKILSGEWSGYRTYRFTRKYRIIYKIFEEKILFIYLKLNIVKMFMNRFKNLTFYLLPHEYNF